MGRTYVKSVKRAEKADRRPHAIAKYIRISPFKVRAVLDLIRGQKYRTAVGILENLNKSSSLPVLKVLKSAGANAANNFGYNTDEMFVAKCFADKGPTLKRYMHRAHGRAASIMKRTSHITVVLDTING